MVYQRLISATVLVPTCMAENGAKATYFNAGTWSGYQWMSSTQPIEPQKNTADECGDVPPACWASSGFACGPGAGSAGGNEQIQIDGENIILTCTASGNGIDTPSSLNAQLYMSSAHVVDGELYSQEVMNKQRKFTHGDFVWYIDKVEVDGQRRDLSDWQPTDPLVIGLYLYSPNLDFNGAVDCTHELDVEYAGWGSPLAFTSWPGVISTGIEGSPIRESTKFKSIPDNSCVGMRWAENQVTYFQWHSPNATDCTQDKIESCLLDLDPLCAHHAVPYSHMKGSCEPGGTDCIDMPISDPMTPSMNLWTTNVPNWTEAKLTLGAFKYFPAIFTV